MKTTIELTDPRALRALAHPTRLALVGLLRSHGSLTATQAGQLLGQSSGSCSFHLRQLAQYGFVEEVNVRGRQKPWRATALSTSWPQVATAPEMASAVRLLDGIVIEQYSARMLAWLDRRASEPLEWQRAAWFGDALLCVTADELNALGRQIRDLLAPYEQRRGDLGQRPAGSRMVTAIQVAIPHQEIADESAALSAQDRTEPS